MSTEEQVTPENQNQFLSSGIDSLYATYALDMACGAIDFGELEYLKTRIRDDPTRQSERITLGGLDLHLLPIGQHPYRYALENREFVIRLAERMQPSCAVQFKSEALWAKGYRALNQQIEDWARALGLVQPRPCGVSRLDFAFDYHLPYRNVRAPRRMLSGAMRARWRRSALELAMLSCAFTTSLRKLRSPVKRPGSIRSGGAPMMFGALSFRFGAKGWCVAA